MPTRTILALPKTERTFYNCKICNMLVLCEIYLQCKHVHFWNCICEDCCRFLHRISWSVSSCYSRYTLRIRINQVCQIKKVCERPQTPSCLMLIHTLPPPPPPPPFPNPLILPFLIILILQCGLRGRKQLRIYI